MIYDRKTEQLIYPEGENTDVNSEASDLASVHERQLRAVRDRSLSQFSHLLGHAARRRSVDEINYEIRSRRSSIPSSHPTTLRGNSIWKRLRTNNHQLQLRRRSDIENVQNNNNIINNIRNCNGDVSDKNVNNKRMISEHVNDSTGPFGIVNMVYTYDDDDEDNGDSGVGLDERLSNRCTDGGCCVELNDVPSLSGNVTAVSCEPQVNNVSQITHI